MQTALWTLAGLALLLGATATTTSSARPDLGGHVTDDHGTPLPKATVYVYTAGVRTGTSTMCPSCWADCGKSAATAADGSFHIPSVSPDLVFRLLVVAEGYEPAFMTHVDPLGSKSVEAKLKARPAGDVDPARVICGRVLNPEGQPVVGAVVSPFGCKTAAQRWWGSVDKVDPMSVTNARGEWSLVAKEPVLGVDVTAEARGLATARFPLLTPGATTPHDLRLGRGATVTGRLVKDGKPLPGARVGLVQADRRIETFSGHTEIGTDDQGRFTFANVAPAGDFYVYGIMDTLKEQGATGTKTVTIPKDDDTAVDAGDLVVAPGHVLAGRVTLSDGKPLPQNTRLQLSLDDAWDSQLVPLNPDGTFRVTGLPDGQVVSVSLAIKGYRLAKANRSVDQVNRELVGKVDRDIENLSILLEPGDYPPYNQLKDDFSKNYERLHSTRIQGAE